MREVRPYGAPSAWAADELRTRLMFQRIRVEHDAGVTAGIFDNARGTDVEVIDYDGQP